jgi:glycosyltransferase involved in cell wall biosynthesis
VGESARIRTNWLATPNGIDLAVFPPAGYAERHEARRRLGLAAAPLAVCLARVCRQKGQDSLLAAWPSVRATVPGAQLALVGDLGADGATILNRARFPEGAFHVGHDDDPRSWYAAANVVVAASRWEGMALTLREAIACGRSVVATDVPGVRESVPDGAGGVVPANDSEALAAALFRRLSDLAFADTEGATGAVHAHRFFGIEDSNNAMAAAYDQVLGHLGMSSR